MSTIGVSEEIWKDKDGNTVRARVFNGATNEEPKLVPIIHDRRENPDRITVIKYEDVVVTIQDGSVVDSKWTKSGDIGFEGGSGSTPYQLGAWMSLRSPTTDNPYEDKEQRAEWSKGWNDANQDMRKLRKKYGLS